jgi:NADPH:quinone reductase-like Zn-dependent oxidoreductase
MKAAVYRRYGSPGVVSVDEVPRPVGASGAVGAAAVQLARHFGATVTGVCSGANTGLAHKLGAGTVIDYTKADFTRAGQTYDVIFDVAGTSSFTRCRAAYRRVDAGHKKGNVVVTMTGHA